jgi:hypothetical protein
MEGVIVVVRVFSRTEEEEERNDDYVGGSPNGVVSQIRRCWDWDPADDRNWDGLDMERCRVRVLPRVESPLEAEVDLVHGVEPWVVGPHLEERLRNVPYIIFNQSLPEGIAADCKFPRMYLVGEDLRKGILSWKVWR